MSLKSQDIKSFTVKSIKNFKVHKFLVQHSTNKKLDSQKASERITKVCVDICWRLVPDKDDYNTSRETKTKLQFKNTAEGLLNSHLGKLLIQYDNEFTAGLQWISFLIAEYLINTSSTQLKIELDRSTFKSTTDDIIDAINVIYDLNICTNTVTADKNLVLDWKSKADKLAII